MNIQLVDFKELAFNSSTSRSSLVAELEAEDGLHYIKLDKTISFEEREDNEYEVVASTVKSMMVSSMIIYDKTTLFFEENPEIIQALKEELKEKDEIAVIKSNKNVYIGTPPSDIKLIVDGVVKSKDEDIDISESKNYEKEDLKAYETPSDAYDILLSAQQTIMFDQILNLIMKGYAKNVVKAHSSDVKSSQYSSDIFQMELSTSLLRAVGGIELGKDTDASEHNKKVVNDFLKMENEQEDSSTLVKKLQDISNKMFPLKLFYDDLELREFVKDISGFDNKRVAFPVLDLQAGSGNGLLSSFDNAGYKDNLIFGTEIRKNIKQDDPRYQVKTGKNSAVYGSAIENVMSMKNISLAIKNLQIYSNPPYTSEDYVAKKTFETLAESNSLFYGVYSTKSQKLLKHQIDGVIIDVPREITGYTDPKTPERFLMVFGGLHAEDTTVSDKAGSLFGGVKSLPTNKMLNFDIKEDESIRDAKKRLSFLISNSIANMPFLHSRFKEQYNYYAEGSENRLHTVKIKFNERIEKFENFINSLEDREKALEKAKDRLFKQFTPLDIAKSQKVFPDTRYYNKEGKPEKYYFRQVVNNVSLLTDYQQKSPSLFNIITEVAKDLKIKIPIAIEKNENFKITEENKPEKKTLVTNMELGLMKSKYYPSVIDLSQDEYKNELVEIVGVISEKLKISPKKIEKDLDTLKDGLFYATKMVLKNEQVIIPEDGIIQNRECYVLQDENEKDIGKINTSLTDFYQELERRGRFNINDYVEEVTVHSELKSILVKNMIKYTENIARTIEGNKDISQSKIIKGAFLTRKKIGEEFKKFNNNVDRLNKDSIEYKEEKESYTEKYRKLLLGFIRENKISDYLEDKIIYPDLNKLLNTILKDDVYSHLRAKDKTGIKQIIADRFIGREMMFYERKIEEQIYFKEAMKDYAIEGEKFDNFFYGLYDTITPLFVAKKSSVNAYIKLGAMFVLDYTKMKHAELTKKDPVQTFDNCFENMFLNTFELKPHQYNEAINTIALDKKLNMLLWEMRSGKTLTMAANLFLTGLAKNNNMTLFVETANLQDISSQVFEFMPQMFFQMRVFHTEPKKVALNEDIVYERLLSEKFYPNILSILNKRDSGLVVGGGTTINELKKSYNSKMENLLEHLNVEDFNLDKIKEQYKDSPLIEILNLCD